MMSRTVRYFKLMYIVAGILTSNEEICKNVDKIQIAPRVEVKEMLQPKRVYRGVEKVSRSWLRGTYLYLLGGVKRRLEPVKSVFNIWALPNYLIDCSTCYISNKFMMNSDCDMIYHK